MSRRQSISNRSIVFVFLPPCLLSHYFVYYACRTIFFANATTDAKFLIDYGIAAVGDAYGVFGTLFHAYSASHASVAFVLCFILACHVTSFLGSASLREIPTRRPHTSCIRAASCQCLRLSKACIGWRRCVAGIFPLFGAFPEPTWLCLW